MVIKHWIDVVMDTAKNLNSKTVSPLYFDIDDALYDLAPTLQSRIMFFPLLAWFFHFIEITSTSFLRTFVWLREFYNVMMLFEKKYCSVIHGFKGLNLTWLQKNNWLHHFNWPLKAFTRFIKFFNNNSIKILIIKKNHYNDAHYDMVLGYLEIPK